MKFLKVFALFLAASLFCTAVSERVFFEKNEKRDGDGDSEKELSSEVNVKEYSDFAKDKAFVTEVDVSARSALLCTSDGMTVYEKNADVPLPMASITKIMTVICALETVVDLSETAVVPNEAVGIEGSSVYLAYGETVTYEMLLYSAMLESANDAVTALAILCKGSEEAFVSAMNEKAQQLSMNSTHFCNPHGLSENEHYTTARDYVKLMSYALENETFCEIIATKKKAFQKCDGSMTRVLSNHNKLLNSYVGMLGGKTGFTKISGRTLITAAQRNGVTLICITLDAPNDWNDHIKLFDIGFEAVKKVSFSSETAHTEIDVAGATETLVVRLKRDTEFCVKKSDNVEMKLVLPHIVFAPVQAGEEVGRAEFYKNGEKIAEAPLVAESTVTVPKSNYQRKGILKQLLDFLKIGNS